MKVIFLDVDGVLNYEGCDSYYGGVYFVLEEKMRLLAEIVRKTEAKIVLTSTWRQGAADLAAGRNSFEADLYEALQDALEEHDLQLYGFTKWDELTRGEQIGAWIRHTEKETETVEAFVILDDLEAGQFGQYADCLIQTDLGSGLEKHHVALAIRLLNL